MNPPKKAQIMSLLEEGLSYRVIEASLHVSSKTIADVVQNRTSARSRGGQPKITPEIEDFIETNTLTNARISDGQMARMVQERFGVTVNCTTICRVRRDMGFQYRPPMSIQKLTPEQKMDRVSFAREMPKILNENDNVIIVFSDESRFCWESDNGWVHVRRGEWNETATRRREKFAKGVMVWGAIARNYLSRLIVCSCNVDSAEYQQILSQSNFIEDMNIMHGPAQWYFMQDGAPCHTAQKTLAFLATKCKILPGWPANSPDLNPIEMIWAILKKRLARRSCDSTGDLLQMLIALWQEITTDTVNALVESFRKRLELVILVNGESISQYLSSHMTPNRTIGNYPC